MSSKNDDDHCQQCGCTLLHDERGICGECFADNEDATFHTQKASQAGYGFERWVDKYGD